MNGERPGIAVDLRALVGQPTGIGYYTLLMLDHLARRHRLRFLGLAHAAISAEAELRASGVAFERRPAPLGVWWQQVELPRRLRRGDLDLLWSPLMTLPLRLPVPGVVTVHDLTPLLFPEAHRWKVRLSLLPFLRESLEKACRVVSVSHATASDLRRHFPQCTDRIRVIHHGVEPLFRPAEDREIAAIRSELECPAGYVLSVGTLEPRKNVHLLVDVWESMRREDRAVPPLVICGGYGWRSRRLLRRIESLHHLGLRYLGYVERERLARLFQGARLFVYPSLYEGFGLPAAEAIACGAPTVASNRASLPEVLGDAGILIDPDDADGLAQAMRRVLSSPALAAELREKGIRRSERFRWPKAAAAMEEVLLEALQEASPGEVPA